MSKQIIATFHGPDGRERVVEKDSPDFPEDLLFGSDYRIKDGQGHVTASCGGDRDRALEKAQEQAGRKKK